LPSRVSTPVCARRRRCLASPCTPRCTRSRSPGTRGRTGTRRAALPRGPSRSGRARRVGRSCLRRRRGWGSRAARAGRGGGRRGRLRPDPLGAVSAAVPQDWAPCWSSLMYFPSARRRVGGT
jgi:hypothetical protein